MGLSVAAVHKSLRAIPGVVACMGMVVVGVVQPAHAQQNIHAIVCADSASLQIDQPLSDSVVAAPDVTISGSVGQSNQLEVYMDGQLDSVVPLPSGSTTFEAVARLAPGTHTIKLEAIDACQVKNATASIVMTYQPAVTASTGSTTPTQVEAGVVIGGTPPSSPEASVQNPIVRLFVEPLRNAADALDLIPPADAVPSAGLPQPVRLVLVAGGAAVITFSSALLGVDWINRLLHLAALRIGLRNEHGTRLILVAVGILTVAIAFLL